MKKNVSRVALEFEKLLNEEFPIKMDTKKPVNSDPRDCKNKYDNENVFDENNTKH